MKKLIKIPHYHLVSTDPDRINSEDHIRRNFDPSTFYESRSKLSNDRKKQVMAPIRREKDLQNLLCLSNV